MGWGVFQGEETIPSCGEQDTSQAQQQGASGPFTPAPPPEPRAPPLPRIPRSRRGRPALESLSPEQTRIASARKYFY